jgi:hypothetical protein
MAANPPLTQVIGRSESTLRSLLYRVLGDTGGTFHQWVALSITASHDGTFNRAELIDRVTDAVADAVEAEAAVTELQAYGLVHRRPDSKIALTDDGRERHTLISTAIAETTAPLYADLAPDDLVATRRVLQTITQRAESLRRVLD